MAKATALSPELMTVTEVTPVMPSKTSGRPKATLSARIVPLQIRIPVSEFKAIKIAAVEAEQTISKFMISCFHSYIKK
jgi:hypothetical protein